MPYCALQTMLDPPGESVDARGYYRFSFIDELTDGAVDTIVAGAEVAPSPMSVVLLQPLGGAFGRVGEMDTALGHRDADWGIQVLAPWLEPERDTSNRSWVRAMTDALSPWARPAGFPNFIAEAGDAAGRAPAPTAPSATRGWSRPRTAGIRGTCSASTTTSARAAA